MRLHQGKNWLHQKYIIEKLPLCEIAILSGCCAATILNYLRKNNIKTRTRHETSKGHVISEETRRKISETHKKNLANKGRIPWNKGKKCPQLSKSIKKWFRENPRARRGENAPWWGKHHSEETKQKLRINNKGRQAGDRNPMYGVRGINSPGWKGGISKLPYSFDFDKKLKEKIRKRDNYICQYCHKEEKELNSYHKKLSIHHIDYNKKNSSVKNLITLCHNCNGRVNSKREYWTNYFQELGMEV